MTATQATYTLDAWRAEARRRGGGDLLDCPFICPLCGNVATPRQFKDAGAEGGRAARECLGRATGAPGGLRSGTPRSQPCDWAAFGLFGTLGKGVTVVYPDGREVEAFAFAPTEASPA